ncbi:MAG TPA: DeoR family transcriptional regulator [Micromonosporaceae bacterium]|nr:DeoR family transcriptional regulator [Micromonosporaceae bacterium]HCU49812.1 DeoR family transcriptional regulator [Micromonosporaceae bacterium]
MLAPQRHQAILARVDRHGGVRVSELMLELGVSDATIRHDLETLAGLGLLAKVHGGATRIVTGSAEEVGFAASARRRRREKEAIGARAAALIKPGAAVAVSAGTTTWAAARHMTKIPGLTIVTNSIPVAGIFYQARGPDQTVVLTGGVRTPSDALVGSVAVAAIRSLHFDVVLLGVYGMTVRTGFTTPNLLESETNQAMVSAARQLVVLADHTKWETIGISTIAALSEANVLITDSGLDAAARETLTTHVGDLIIVPTR